MAATRRLARRLLQHATVAYAEAQYRHPLEVLERVARARQTLRELEGEAVTEARAAGVTWQAIGDALGENRQTVHERHRSQRSRPKATDE